MLAKKGDWVMIYNIVLEPKDRAPQIPEETKKVPILQIGKTLKELLFYGEEK
jgi:hypothetical protein